MLLRHLLDSLKEQRLHRDFRRRLNLSLQKKNKELPPAGFDLRPPEWQSEMVHVTPHHSLFFKTYLMYTNIFKKCNLGGNNISVKMHASKARQGAQQSCLLNYLVVIFCLKTRTLKVTYILQFKSNQMQKRVKILARNTDKRQNKGTARLFG